MATVTRQACGSAGRATPAREPDGDRTTLRLRHLGLLHYEPVWQAMRARALTAAADAGDEIWLLSHHPVFTLGQAGRGEHVLRAGDIPVVRTDRGGQVTYHGPGQLVAYVLVNLRRRRLGVRQLVAALEAAVIECLAEFGIQGERRPRAPGVYVTEGKIAALGLRVKNGWSYHGLSLNVRMDLEPFSRINPCGFANLAVTQLADLTSADAGLERVVEGLLARALAGQLAGAAGSV